MQFGESEHWKGKTLWRWERRTTIPTIIEKKIYWIIKIYYTCWIEWHPLKMILQPKMFSPRDSEGMTMMDIRTTHRPIIHHMHTHTPSLALNIFILGLLVLLLLFIHIYENSIHSSIRSLVIGSWEREKSCVRSPFIQIMMVKSISNEITFWIPSVCWLFLFFHLIACIWIKIIAWHKTFEVKQRKMRRKKKKNR